MKLAITLIPLIAFVVIATIHAYTQEHSDHEW